VDRAGRRARHQLDLIRAEATRRGVHIHILVDFIHVLEYLCRAVWCFYQDADPAAEPWVATHALRILAGEVDTVITTLHQQATAAGLTPQQRGGVDACIGYLKANGSSSTTPPPWRPAGRSPPASSREPAGT
jgi:hypothetical protein